MNKLVLVYNPRSAHHELIKKEVLAETRTLSGWMVAKFEVKPLKMMENAERLARILDDGDLVIAAGGDGTATMTANGVLKSQKKVTLSVLGYGHFNDFARTLGTTQPVEYGGEYLGGVVEIVRKFENGETRKYYPLKVLVNGELWRYAICYLTLGMAAAATEIFDQKDVRKNIRKTSHPKSYFRIAKWYLRHRKGQEFLPPLKLNGIERAHTTDVIALNSPYMAKVMRGDKWYEQTDQFAAGGFWLKKSRPLFKFMMRSMFKQIPLTEMDRLTVEFTEPASLMAQTEGEHEKLSDVQTIEVEKDTEIYIV